ncbi:hypothetical protein PoB_002999000 [Plakobranchus ocellatus]|uniref:Uncharacterized protein n=1 Tax=Plakobranchus ocellatus TaxID=259542 RepID=A0AAV4A7Y5_9GAST|nr:hypothetical protein PoB_002999000 [Plakobranchus ocellatus]
MNKLILIPHVMKKKTKPPRLFFFFFFFFWGVRGTVACESALRSAGTLLSRAGAPPSVPRPDRGPKSPRSLVVDWLYTITNPLLLLFLPLFLLLFLFLLLLLPLPLLLLLLLLLPL